MWFEGVEEHGYLGYLYISSTNHVRIRRRFKHGLNASKQPIHSWPGFCGWTTDSSTPPTRYTRASITTTARQGTYLIKAVDKNGNFSSNATAIISNVTSPLNFNAVATQAEHPSFAGTFSNTVLVDGAIKLDSSEQFDSATGNFDDDTTRFFDSVQVMLIFSQLEIIYLLM